MDDLLHFVLYLIFGTLAQNEQDILLKWRGRFLKVIHDFSFLEHPWPLGMKFLPFS